MHHLGLVPKFSLAVFSTKTVVLGLKSMGLFCGTMGTEYLKYWVILKYSGLTTDFLRPIAKLNCASWAALVWSL